MEVHHRSYCPECYTTFPDETGFCPFHGKGLTAIHRHGDLSGTVIEDRYRLIGPVARRGRLGVSYRAKHLLIEKDVLVKVFDPLFNENPEALKRFMKVSGTQVALKNRYCVPVFDFGLTRSGLLFRVSEWNEGPDLLLEQERGRVFRAREAMQLVMDVCKCVEELHSEGTLHLSVKPSNVLISAETGKARIGEAGDAGLLVEQGGVRLSPLGLSLLNPYYAAPEQMAGKSLDVYTDVYALGVLLSELLLGQTPYPGRTPLEVMRAKLASGLTCPSELGAADIPRLKRLLAAALEPHPLNRTSSVSAFRNELDVIVRKEADALDACLEGVRRTAAANASRRATSEASKPQTFEAAKATPEATPAAVSDPLYASNPALSTDGGVSLDEIWNELDRDAKNLFLARKKKTAIGALVGVAAVALVLVFFLGDIIMGAKRLLNIRTDAEVLNEAADSTGPRRQDKKTGVPGYDKNKLLDKLADMPLDTHLGEGEQAPLLSEDLATVKGGAVGVDKALLARKLEKSLGAEQAAGAAGQTQKAPGGETQQPAGVAAQVQAPAAGALGGSEATQEQLQARAASAQAQAAAAAAAAKAKSDEELSRAKMSQDDFDLAKMAMDFGKKQFARGQYDLAIENFKNAKRLGWHEATVDGLIAKATGRLKDMETSTSQGKKLMAQGKYEEAIPYFRKAQQLGDDSNTTNNLILECEDRLAQQKN